MLCSVSSFLEPAGSLMERAPVCWRLKCPDEVRYFIRIQLCTLQHTIVAVIANG